ncbi:MAG: hypothetical protein H3C47_11270 [Candidatus Cloacimonetes bacterium]|nr:hypothetical protein [Candidatus Cloacimonadota bacterium]
MIDQHRKRLIPLVSWLIVFNLTFLVWDTYRPQEPYRAFVDCVQFVKKIAALALDWQIPDNLLYITQEPAFLTEPVKSSEFPIGFISAVKIENSALLVILCFFLELLYLIKPRLIQLARAPPHFF